MPPLFIEAPTGREGANRWINIGDGRIAEYTEDNCGDQFSETEYEITIVYANGPIQLDSFKGEAGLVMAISLMDFHYENKIVRKSREDARKRAQGRR